MKLDTQAIEVLGRNRLVTELVRAGLEVAFPIRDRGIDLIAYWDRPPTGQQFSAVPIQMKGAGRKSFVIERKYAKVPQLLIAYVWGIAGSMHETFAMTYLESLEIATELDYTKTDSWLGKLGKYSSSRPSKKLESMIREFHMTPEKWRKKFVARTTIQEI